MFPIAVLTLLSLTQMTYAKKGEILQRPVIPDYGMIRQNWVMDELKLSLATRKELNSNPMWTPAKLREATRKGGTYSDTTAIKIASPHKARLAQLSLWYHDLFALTDPATAAKVGLSKELSKKVDAKFEAYFIWRKKEIERQEKISLTETSKRVMPSIDPVVAQKIVIKLRGEVRAMLPQSVLQKLRALKGKAPATIQPFGWLGGELRISMYASPQFFLNPRVHEELGFSMKHSRLLMEHRDSDIEAQLKKLNPSQAERYRQLELQNQGPIAIMRHDIADALGISDRVYDELYVSLSNLERKQSSWSAEDLRRLEEKRRQMIYSALTKAQKDKYAKMLGVIVPEIGPMWLTGIRK